PQIPLPDSANCPGRPGVVVARRLRTVERRAHRCVRCEVHHLLASTGTPGAGEDSVRWLSRPARRTLWCALAQAHADGALAVDDAGETRGVAAAVTRPAEGALV